MTTAREAIAKAYKEFEEAFLPGRGGHNLENVHRGCGIAYPQKPRL